VALDARPPTHERLAVEVLELVEARAVDEARDQLARIEERAVVVRHKAVELGGSCTGGSGSATSQGAGAGGRCRFATILRASASACSSDVA